MPEINKPASEGIRALNNIVEQLPKSPLPSQLLYILMGTFITIITLVSIFSITKTDTKQVIQLCKIIMGTVIVICLIVAALDLLRIIILRNERNMVIKEHNNIFAIQRGNVESRGAVLR